ncbi:MAG: response regulator [Treponemataceae bacterium]|nr:response regulator [Treponemataceae bacterium]
MEDYLDRKAKNPNSKNIPVVICGPVAPKEQIEDYVQYGVVKYFHKPVRFDVFFEFLSSALKTLFILDTTPSILELHVNNDILFIEIAQGLNRDKMSLLQYKITEILDAEKLTAPKVIVMLTDLTLSFVDGTNLEKLLDSILADPRIKPNNVKILSFDSFTKELIEGHREYQGVSVATSLQNVLYSVVDNTETNDMADFINDNILTATADISQGSMEISYNPEDISNKTQLEDQDFTPGASSSRKIAVVDDDENVLQFLKKTFSSDSAVYLFRTGRDFLQALDKNHFDMTILDINMPEMSGFDVLKILQDKRYIDPVIVYSMISDKNSIFKAISLGARNYLVKPQSPDAIVQTVNKVLNAEF